MRPPVEISRASLRVVAAALVAVGAAGCSADVSRFDDNPFANPYASKNSPPRETTGSAAPIQSAPSSRIESQPLPQTQSYQPLPPPPGRQSGLSEPPGTAIGSTGIASYSPAPAPVSSDITGAVRPAPAAARHNWDWDGGTAVTVAPGETVDTLSRRYGVPSAAIMQANGLTSASSLQPGQRVVIPRYNSASVAAADAPANHPFKPAAIVAGGAPSTPRASGPRVSQPGGVHVVQPNETLTSISRHYGKTVTEVAAANHIPPYTRVKMGDRITIPGTASAALAPRPQLAPLIAAPRTQPPVQKLVRAEPSPRAQVLTSPPEARDDGNVGATSSGGAPSFGWPARGRVIAGFGEKLPSGQLNDGINLAIPEGTAVRAAEDGVVAYAGSELRGYGNLILVRHPNGFVTAYAHTSEILVKRNDPVKRGQVIARSGATGSVATPQLHFETRKGSAPVNPIQYLPAGV
jgi:murein DD-endopeptidase MepM/ murein hydrolase activator NlpD